VPEEDVGLAIAVEVPHATTVQSVEAPPGDPAPMTVVPFIR